MSVKYLVLNVSLCLVIFLIAIKNYEIWNHPIELYPNTGIESKNSETKNENPPVTASAKETIPVQPPIQSPAQSYFSMSEKNIFNPERKDFPTVTAGKSSPVTRPQVILYGVTIAGDFQSASVVNPGRPLRKEERETLTLKVGERIGGYKLAKILPDRIAMENNGDTFEVLLYDFKNPKKRLELKAEAKPATISSTQPPPVPASTEGQKTTPSQEPGEKPKEPVQRQTVQAKPQVASPLPYNKYTYRLLGPSAAISRGNIFYPPSPPAAQASEEN